MVTTVHKNGLKLAKTAKKNHRGWDLYILELCSIAIVSYLARPGGLDCYKLNQEVRRGQTDQDINMTSPNIQKAIEREPLRLVILI